MKLEEMEENLERALDGFNPKYMIINYEALSGYSNAVQALLMVRQEMDRQRALNQAVEPEKGDWQKYPTGPKKP